jgi:hypothetical protein
MPDHEENHSHKAISAYDRDKMSPVWDMSQERAFIENLLNQRFMIAISFTMSTAVNTKTDLQLKLVLTFGAVIAFMFGLVLRRSQEKLDLIITDLKADNSHPLSIIDSRADSHGSRRKIIGVAIPFVCISTLIAGAVLAWFGVLTVC